MGGNHQACRNWGPAQAFLLPIRAFFGNTKLMDVEVSLRIPNMKVRALDENGYPIDHSAVRFKKMVTVPSVPKAGASLQLTTRAGKPFEAKVVRSDWEEERGLFVVSCQY